MLRNFVPLVLFVFSVLGCKSATIRPLEQKKAANLIPLSVVVNELDSGRFYLPCSYDGRTESFYLDTGANHTVIGFNEFTARYPVIGEKRTASASGKEHVAGKVILGSLSIGPVTLPKFEVVRYASTEKQDNRLGINAFAGQILQFDFHRNTLLISEEFDGAALPGVLKTLPSGLISLPVNMKRESFDAVWDTGAELSTIDIKIVERNPDNFHFIQNIDEGLDGLGNPVAFKLYSVKNLSIGSNVFSGNVLAMDFGPLRKHFGDGTKMILGFNFLRKVNWILDLRHGNWMIR